MGVDLMTITEKQNNFLISLTRECIHCKMYSDEYMTRTKDNPKERDFQYLLDKLTRINGQSKEYSYPIKDETVRKICTFIDRDLRYAVEVATYTDKRKVSLLTELTEYDGIILKRLWINKYILKHDEKLGGIFFDAY
jgi:hypothetical protein